MTVATNLSLTEDLKKEGRPLTVLKLTTLEIDLHYPEKDLLRVSTDGSQVDETNTAGAGVHCKLFCQYAIVGVNMRVLQKVSALYFLKNLYLCYRHEDNITFQYNLPSSRYI